jgi:hypothetical protein
VPRRGQPPCAMTGTLAPDPDLASACSSAVCVCNAVLPLFPLPELCGRALAGSRPFVGLQATPVACYASAALRRTRLTRPAWPGRKSVESSAMIDP